MVQSLRLVELNRRLYNLTVEDSHTYFVGYGQWLVHSKCGEELRFSGKDGSEQGSTG